MSGCIATKQEHAASIYTHQHVVQKLELTPPTAALICLWELSECCKEGVPCTVRRKSKEKLVCPRELHGIREHPVRHSPELCISPLPLFQVKNWHMHCSFSGPTPPEFCIDVSAGITSLSVTHKLINTFLNFLALHKMTHLFILGNGKTVLN